jgi:hypothetical protein
MRVTGHRKNGAAVNHHLTVNLPFFLKKNIGSAPINAKFRT